MLLKRRNGDYMTVGQHKRSVDGVVDCTQKTQRQILVRKTRKNPFVIDTTLALFA